MKKKTVFQKKALGEFAKIEVAEKKKELKRRLKFLSI